MVRLDLCQLLHVVDLLLVVVTFVGDDTEDNDGLKERATEYADAAVVSRSSFRVAGPNMYVSMWSGEQPE